MGIFSFLFGGGKYPTTAKYEAQLEQRKSDYAKFQRIGGGAELKRYEELKRKLSTSEFKSAVNHLKNDRFNQTEEYRKEQEYKSLAKSSDIKDYLKFVGAGKDRVAEQAINSAEYKEYLSLRTASDPEKKKRLKELKGSQNVKTAVRMAGSGAYKNYMKVHNSDRLKKYEALKEYVKTEAFVAKKRDLENKNRFKESEQWRELQEFGKLEGNKDLKWYYECVKNNTFADVDKWELVFADEFKGGKLDGSKWMTGYYWGKKTAGVTYSLADERQKFDDGNIKVGNGLTIATRAGKAEGVAWNAQVGFVKAQFDATAALVNTGDGFRQKFGKYEFKVKVTGAKSPVTDNIWLRSDNNLEVNVATFGVGKNVVMGVSHRGLNKLGSVGDVNYGSDYYIYALEWTQDKLTWSVNGVEVYSTKANVPQEPMYIGISSNVVGEGDIANADMSVAWVKVYTRK